MKKTVTGTITAILFALIGVLVLVGSRAVSVEAVYPVERAKQSFGRQVVSRVVGCFRGVSASAENVRLRREVASLAMVRNDLERLETENARLRRALDYRARNPEEWLAAGVLSANGAAASVRDTLRVDKGTLDGVRTGAVVVVPEGLVGRVTSVTPHTAEVTLVTDVSLKVACEVELVDRARPQGILCGGGEEALRLRYLTHAANLPPRARVLTSGRGGVYPKGLEIGTLLDVQTDVNGLATEGEVLPSVEYSTLEDVFIRREK